MTPEPLPQLRPPPPSPRSLNSDRQRLPLPDEHDETLAAGHPRVDQVPLQHRVVTIVVGEAELRARVGEGNSASTLTFEILHLPACIW